MTSFILNNWYAQDKIVLKTKDTLEVKVAHITESITIYKSSSYQDGPSYELKNSKIDKIIFANGKEEYFDLYDKYYTAQKNAIEIIFSDMSMSRISLAYTRKLGKHFNIRAQGGAAIGDDNLFDPYHEIKNFVNFQTLYFPYSHTKVAYYTGLDYRFGSFYAYRHYNYNNYGGFYGVQQSIENFSRYGLVNGIEINFNKSMSINAYFTTGFLQEVNTKYVNAKIDGGISLCAKF